MSSLPQELPGYELIRELGVGGMATVYLALQQALDRQVALKVMRRDASGADISDFERRFLLEGRTMAKLPHRNIVAVYDIVTRPDISYIAMEYLSAGTLSERLRRGLDLSEAIAIVVQLANALDLAHKQGVVHRDLKPSNVLFRDETTPVLTDFGIAKHADGATTRITLTGMVLGTPTYMSPEQAHGQAIDGRSDQYSLGVLFYEMLTGNVPFADETPMAVLMAHALKPPPPLPSELGMFQPIFDHLLAKKPDDRYATLRKFVEALRSLILSNETLGMRLRAGNSRTSSSQLRRLGFSGDSSGAGHGITLDMHQRSRETSALSRFDPTRLAPALRGGRGVAVAALVVVALGLGAILWNVFGPGSPSTNDEQVTRLELNEARNLIDAGKKLVTPPGDNAFEYLQNVLQRDADNRQAVKLVDTLAEKMRGQAQQALNKGDLDAASELINQTLLVKPKDPASEQLAAHIEQQRNSREHALRVTELLNKAASAANEPGAQADTIYGLLASARKIDPSNPTVQLRIAQLTKTEFDRVRAQLNAGHLDEASSMLDALRPNFGNDIAFDPLALAVEHAKDMATRASKAADLLARARKALDESHIDRPAGDNAVDLFFEARALDVRLPAVAAFGNELTGRLMKDATSAQSNKNFERALTLAEVALRVDPDDNEAKSLLAAAQSKLGARRSAIASQLNIARQSLANGNLLPPGKDNARDVLEALLKTEPTNKDARVLLGSLPKAIVDTATAELQRGNLDDASALLTSANGFYPNTAEFKHVAGEIASARQQRQAAKDARERMQHIADLISERPISLEHAKLIANELVVARRDKQDTAALEHNLTDALAADIKEADTVDAVNAALASAQAVSSVLGARPALDAIASDGGKRWALLQQKHDEALEAQKGELVINALPWGTVDKVLDANREPMRLPTDHDTPLRLKLPAGSYYVTVTHPGISKGVSLFARVKAKDTIKTVARFQSLTADAYLRHAGL
ncbi:MAG: protein kinase [Rhodanobacteraceae bacterium]